jgi:hypothetical protein
LISFGYGLKVDKPQSGTNNANIVLLNVIWTVLSSQTKLHLTSVFLESIFKLYLVVK